MDWSADARSEAFEAFVQGLIAIRKGRDLMLADRFLHAGPDLRGRRYARWLMAEGGEMQDGDWDDENLRCLGLLLHEAGDALLLLMNADHEDRAFHLPGGSGRTWLRLVDTAEGYADPDPGQTLPGDTVDLPARSLLLLETRFHG